MLRLRLLGSLDVEREGHGVALGGPQQRVVLAYLALHVNAVVTTRQLVDVLWSDTPPNTATQTVHVHVSLLRKALGHDDAQPVIVTRGGGYMLQVPSDAVDLEQFRALAAQADAATRGGAVKEAVTHLRAAMALWRGPALGDLLDNEALQVEAAHLEETRRGTMEKLIDLELTLGGGADVVDELRRLVAEDPLRERFRLQLMLALYRQGRQAQALEVYDETRRLLAEELGIDPGRELQDMQQKVLRHDPSLDHGRRRVAVPVQPPDAPEELPQPPVRARRRGVVLVAVAVLLVGATAWAVGWSRGRTPEPLGAVTVQTLALLDPATGGVIGQVEVDAPITRIAVGDDSIWVSSEVAGTLVRVDPVLRAVRQTIPVGGGASGIAFGDGAVWVTTSANRSVARVDPDTNEVVQRVTTGNAPTDVAMAAGSLWVTNRLDGTVSQIDPESGKQLRAIAVGTSPVAIAGDDSALWVADSWEGTVVRLDPRTGAVTATINVGNGPSAIAAGEAVWVANAVDGTVSQISPASNAVVSTVSVGGNPSGVVAVEGGAWVTTDVDGIVRVDSRTGQVQRRLATDSRPVSVAAADSSVWTGVAPAGDAHRGGTLRIVSDLDADSVDPAAASEGEALTIQGLLYDGLIGPKRTGGPSSLELVPNLATSLPHPVDGGKTYTFQLRRGVRYSTGDPVRPADFRHAIERAFAIQPAAADAFGSIRGADTCRKQPGACDLSDGIVADDTQSTVTFHLTRPDSEFLYGLASTAAAAVPSDTPRRQMESVPSTGAYMVESFSHHDRIVLTRNPYFRAWSAPARPSGYVDRIEWRMGVDLDEAVELVADGEADWFDSVQPELPLDRLRIYNAGQLHVYPRPATYSMFLNTRAAPFDDIAVRRALNFAVDRAEGVRLLGGPDEATVTCQIHPPNHPNYVPYCPYTGGATNSGRWEQPDLEQAKRLIAASKTRGTKVEVWALAPLFGKVGRYFVGLLDDLGYDATLHIERDPSRYFETVAEADREVQIGAVGWFLGGSPSPSGLFTIYTCASFDRDPLRNLNFSGLCSPRVDRLVRRARAAQTLSPARAAPLWREVERVLVDLAPSVPLANPNAVDFVSGRVGNYRSSPALQLLPDQVWVQ